MPRLSPSRIQDNFPGCDYSDEEREFLLAIDRYKRECQRPHPSWREVLQVFKALGYAKVAAPRPPRPPDEEKK